MDIAGWYDVRAITFCGVEIDGGLDADAPGRRDIEEMTRRIVERFDPRQVILFGSQARGDAHADSDVDLLVVYSHVENTRLAAVAILDELSGLGISKDVVVSTPDEIAACRHLIGNMLEPAMRERRVLYERKTAA